MERCRREIAAIEAEILAGNPDLPGLCLALADWSTELRILEQEAQSASGQRAENSMGRQGERPRAARRTLQSVSDVHRTAYS